ncbi:MAG TPA: right-handed parallel beta-helix repeat-containing protein [Miltoncostaeaceae bacterium]|nr:right-handed parallel beta-helix repeat-containing protein [Miltoncostaeaceae bacterium]
MKPIRLIPILAGGLLALVGASTALADPGPGSVEVSNDAGAAVGAPLTGPDAISNAVKRIATGALARADDARPWTIVAGAGTYGDVLVNEPNLTIRPSAGAAVVITGSGGVNDTAGDCVQITRGGVTVQGITCRTPNARGIVVTPPAAEGGVVLSGLTVDRAATDGIALLSGAGLLIRDTTVTGSGRDGIALSKATGAGPYRIETSTVRGNGDDGIDLVDDAQRVQIAGSLIESNRGNGIESDDAGSTDLAVDATTSRRNTGSGALLGGAGVRFGITNSVFTNNSRYGMELGRLNGSLIRGDHFDGSNRLGDMRFSADTRAGGAYDGLVFGDTVMALPGEPRGVILSAVTAAARAGLSRLPTGFLAVGRYIRVRDTGAPNNSAVSLRFTVGTQALEPFRFGGVQVFEDDPPANGRRWQAVAGSQSNLAAGLVDATLTDAQIASGSDARSAIYGPLGPANAAPQVLSVYPAQGQAVRGRLFQIGAAVSDDAVLGTGSFALTVDGRRIGGVAFRNSQVIFPFVRVASLGVHQASLLAVDANGIRSVRDWTFRVVNRAPKIVRLRSFPRPKQFVLTRRPVRLTVMVRDDQPVVRRISRVLVDGRPVRIRVLKGIRIVASVPLRQGLHRIRVIVNDRDGARAVGGWTFRVVRP